METRPTLRVRLMVVDGFAAGRTFVVERFPAVVGRGEEADVQLPDDPSEPTLSRRHLRLSIGSGRLQAEDLSTNGTARGGRLLPVGQAVVLDEQEELVLGLSTRLRLEILRAGAWPSEPVPVPEHAPLACSSLGPLELRTLGAFEASLGGRAIPAQAWDTRKPMLVLAYLGDGRPVSPERACDDLWPDTNGARQALQSTLSRLRRTFRRVEAPDPVQLEGGLYRLDPDLRTRMDASECERLSSQARGGEALAPLEELRRLYRGDFLPGFSEDWVLHRRVALNRLYLEAMACLAERLVSAGRGPEAATLYLELLGGDPLWEAGNRGLLEHYRVSGQRDEAVRHYHRYVALLKKEMDLGPSPEMLLLYQLLTT